MGRFQPADGNPDEALVLLIMHWPPESDTTVALSEQRQGSQTFIRAGFNLGLLISYYNFLAVHLPTESQLKDYDNVPELTRKRLNRGTSDIKRAHAKHIIERCKRSGLYQMTIVFGATCRDMLAEALKMAEADDELVVEEINICYRALLPIEMGLPCEETTAAAFCHTHDNAPSAGFCAQRFPNAGSGRQHINSDKIRTISAEISNHRERMHCQHTLGRSAARECRLLRQESWQDSSIPRTFRQFGRPLYQNRIKDRTRRAGGYGHAFTRIRGYIIARQNARHCSQTLPRGRQVGATSAGAASQVVRVSYSRVDVMARSA